MRTIKKSFTDIQAKNPNWGDFVCLIEAVRGRKFSRKTIRKCLLENVNKDDYDKSDLKSLVDQLHVASNIVVDDHFEAKINFLGLEKKEDGVCIKTA